MFRLHDRVKRWIGLAAFVALGLVPTAAVLAWGVGWRLPSHARAEAESLSQRLGLAVSLGGVEHPRPGTVRYLDLEVSHPENGRTFLRCSKIETAWRMLRDQQGRPKPTLLVFAHAPELDAAELAELGRLAQQAIELRLGNADVDVRWGADEVVCRLGDRVERLVDTRGGLQTIRDVSQLWCYFRPAECKSGKPACISLIRNRQTDPPCDGFELNARETRVPCTLLAAGLLPLASLGAEAEFTGYVRAGRTPNGWWGKLESVACDGVDLDRLVSARFEHKLSGPARVTIPLAEFQNGRITHASGTVTAGPGTVSRSLVQAAVEHLGLAAGHESAAIGRVVPYRRLACQFALDSQGLRIGGFDGAEPSTVVLSDEGGPLLGSSLSPRPPAALLEMLSPAGVNRFPASSQTDWLADRMPLIR